MNYKNNLTPSTNEPMFYDEKLQIKHADNLLTMYNCHPKCIAIKKTNFFIS